MKGYHDDYTERLGYAWIAVGLLLGLTVLILSMAGCMETYSVYSTKPDGSIMRTDLTVEHDIPESWGEPEFMRIRAEQHYDAKGNLIGGRTCEQNFLTLKCKAY